MMIAQELRTGYPTAAGEVNFRPRMAKCRMPPDSLRREREGAATSSSTHVFVTLLM